MKLINVPLFIASLSFGLFLVYITSPRPDIIYVYPTPDNLDKIQYKDHADNCFGFKANEVSCPADQKKIRKYPTQEKQKIQGHNPINF
ncbi:hypothetical protein N9S60_00450 [bacterium]|nr:hypothetical protein [bacterium]